MAKVGTRELSCELALVNAVHLGVEGKCSSRTCAVDIGGTKERYKAARSACSRVDSPSKIRIVFLQEVVLLLRKILYHFHTLQSVTRSI